MSQKIEEKLLKLQKQLLNIEIFSVMKKHISSGIGKLNFKKIV